MGFFSKKEKGPYWTQVTHMFRSDEFICSECGHKEKKARKVCPACGKEITKVVYEPSWVDEEEMMAEIFDEV